MSGFAGRLRRGWRWLTYIPPLPCRRCQYLPNEFRPCTRHAEATDA